MSFTPEPDENGVRWYGDRISGKTQEDRARCIEYVSNSASRFTLFCQCSRKRGHGPGGLYCKQHDPEAVKRRADAARKRWDDRWAAEQESRERPIRDARKAALLEAADAIVREEWIRSNSDVATWLRERAEKENNR